MRTNARIRRFRKASLTLFCSALLISSAGDLLAQESPTKALQLPLPAHPERQPEDPEHTAPKAAQPDREARRTQSVSTTRTGNSMPVPGRPGRRLTAPGEAEPESETTQPAQEELPAGLFERLPHSFRDGGWTWEYIYTGETFTKATGGRLPARATNYRSNLDIVSVIDTERMGWWDGGRMFVYGQNLAGKPISADYVGDTQLFSNLDSTISATERPHFTTIAEYWYEHFSFENRWRTKIGKQDANVDFALTDLGGEFIHSSFGVPPNIPLPTFPSQSLGLASFFDVTDTINLGVGVYDGSLPSGPTGVRWGFDTLGHNGCMSMYQLQWKPQFGTNGQLPHTTRVGMWHHSDPNVWTEYTTDPNPRTFVQNYGVFTSTDQMIFKEEYGTDDTQGLGVFGQFGWAPGNRNFIQEYYGGGLVYRGLIPNRDNDVVGLAIANILYSGPYRQVSAASGSTIGSNETAIELFYKILPSQYLSLQPDVQYIFNPSGQYKDALVPGLRFEVVL